MVPPDQKALTRRCPILLHNRRVDHKRSSIHYRDDNDEIDNEGDVGGGDNDKYT